MKQRVVFSNVFLMVLMVCTIMYQSTHSFVHLLDEISHMNVSENEDESHFHFDSKHCQICDFTFSPFTSTEIQTFTFINIISFSQKYFFSEITFEKTFILHSFLRGPPLFI